MYNYKDKLVAWGLEDYIQSFIDEGITDECFSLLDEETINKIFTKCGPKLVFKHHYKQFIDGSSARNTASASTVSVSSEGDSILFEPDAETLKVIESLNTIENLTFFKPPSPLKRSLQNSDSEPEQCSSSKIKCVDSVFPQGLELVLKKYTDGQIALSNKSKLTNDYRQKLCKVIINELIALYGTEIKASTLLRISEEIETIFMNEKACTYYVPYCPGGKDKKSYGPKGKLWSRYVNVKTALRQANTLKKLNIQPTFEDNNEEKHEEENEHLEYLKVATEPYSRILDSWQKTCKIRRRLYLNSNLETIFNDFPCLKLNSGIELIESDFNKRFPEKADAIYTSWPKISAAILKEVKERNISLGQTQYQDNSLHVLLTLPYLFSTTTIKKARNKGDIWRPTRCEVQEGFFMHVSNFDELLERNANRRRKHEEYGLPVQPIASVVGPLEQPDAFYIIVNEHTFKLDTSIRTLELLYKLFHALDLEYPVESEAIWIFIQELVYDTRSVKKNPSSSAVISDIKYHLD